MPKQGKLHSSPFHVETIQYKYAIEHENDGYVIPTSKVECNHKTGKQICRLWNSGFKMCTAHKCHYNQLSMRRTGESCCTCAYYWKKCVHPQCASREKIDATAAEYCCYLLTEADNQDKYHYIKNSIVRMDLTRLLHKNEHLIKSRTKYIKEAEQEMKQYEPTDGTYLYLAKKVAERRKQIAAAEKLVIRLKADLERLGGELQSMPKNSKHKSH